MKFTRLQNEFHSVPGQHLQTEKDASWEVANRNVQQAADS